MPSTIPLFPSKLFQFYSHQNYLNPYLQSYTVENCPYTNLQSYSHGICLNVKLSYHHQNFLNLNWQSQSDQNDIIQYLQSCSHQIVSILLMNPPIILRTHTLNLIRIGRILSIHKFDLIKIDQISSIFSESNPQFQSQHICFHLLLLFLLSPLLCPCLFLFSPHLNFIDAFLCFSRFPDHFKPAPVPFPF